MPSRYELHQQAQAAARQDRLAEAERLLAEDRIDEAEHFLAALHPDLETQVSIARMYQRRLEALAAADLPTRDRPRAEAVYRRALWWAQGAYPDPHTQIEADDFAAGREADRARLVAILGYEPGSA